MLSSSEISAFEPESSPKPGRVCAVTGEPFEVGDKIYSVLYEEDGVIKRRDVLASVWRAAPRPNKALAWWSSRVQSEREKDKKLKLAPNDALTALFVSLADKPNQKALRYALALLLARRRVLKYDYDENLAMRSDPETANSIYVFSPRNETGYFVPIVEMTREQALDVQNRLIELIESPAATLDDKNEPQEEPDSSESAPPSNSPRRVSIRVDSDEAQRRLQATYAAFDSSEISEAAALAAQAALGG